MSGPDRQWPAGGPVAAPAPPSDPAVPAGRLAAAPGGPPGSGTSDGGGEGGAGVGPADAEDGAGAAAGGGARLAGWWRRNRMLALGLLGLLLVAVLVAITQAGTVGGRLDPRSATPEGGRALATLLGDRGVQVQRVTDRTALTTGVTDRTVLFLPFPGLLEGDPGRAVADLRSGTVVLVSPPAEVLETVTDDVRREGFDDVRVRAPGCSEAAAEAAGGALVGGTTFSTGDGATCYRDDGDYAPLVTGRTKGGARLVVVGTGRPFSNEELDQEGNAALALNLLSDDGDADELRWLMPAPGGSGDESAPSILPGWVVPAALQLLFAGLLLALWRGRRLGPPVAEPLPVVVRAAEAVEGRARLYRRAQARDRAARAMRAGALARLVPRLGIDSPAGGEPPPEAVVAAVASRSDRPDAEVYAVLFGPPPLDDAGLVRLTDTLDAMVRATLDPEGPHS